MSWTSEDYYLIDASDADKQIRIRVKRVLTEAVCPFKELPPDWVPQEGTWEIAVPPGAISGCVVGQAAAILWYTKAAKGDHMIEFQASSVPPNSNDLNCLWEGSGTYSDSDPEDFCKIGGVGGWWHGCTGIESSLGNESGDAPRAITHQGNLIIGQIHEIAAGRLTINDTPNDFLFVNGRLIMQVTDPDSKRRESSKVAISTWDSHINVYAARVSRIMGGKPRLRLYMPDIDPSAG